MQQDSIDSCTSQSFKRLFDSLYMHSFKTSEGYIPIVVGVTICAADAGTGFPSPKMFFSFAKQYLKQSYATGVISVNAFNLEQLTRSDRDGVASVQEPH